ncbi:dihydrofolate reductase [Haloplasma contractile]|uniref:Dihydrofolate reductase n=1 Tax=Haloplasma contractile SSD-17B TaxID=1033810 RepID=U2FRI6_9MOLU|nr:dihydrofolate reductase [Haloplasma contractile]ERJ13574.1 Dihydrofolate reductase protein [Haloplasma contractile SSD-17B]
MLSIIVAFDQNRLIGKDNKMPWHFKEDLRYFKEVTIGHKVVMGRKTFESIVSYIGGPLPERDNIVLSRNLFPNDEVESFKSIDDFLNVYKDHDEEVFIIGGKTIYEQLLPFAKRLYITHIEQEYEGDTYFPNVNYDQYIKLNERQSGVLRFCVYERRIKDEQ